ncbi:MAG TPA: exodeoxyribonuclease VII small subunit [bacterium]|jgi:exodeoxyribonuclease VII small subunit
MAKKDKKDKMEEIPAEIAKLSYEDAYAQLRSVTEKLENEEVDLESMLKEYSRASALARHCANLLSDAEERIRVLIEKEGEIVLEPLDD